MSSWDMKNLFKVFMKIHVTALLINCSSSHILALIESVLNSLW